MPLALLLLVSLEGGQAAEDHHPGCAVEAGVENSDDSDHSNTCFKLVRPGSDLLGAVGGKSFQGPGVELKTLLRATLRYWNEVRKDVKKPLLAPKLHVVHN